VLRYGLCVTRGSHRFTCHPHTNHIQLCLALMRSHLHLSPAEYEAHRTSTFLAHVPFPDITRLPSSSAGLRCPHCLLGNAIISSSIRYIYHPDYFTQTTLTSTVGFVSMVPLLQYTGWLKKVSCCTVSTAYFFEPPCILTDYSVFSETAKGK